MPPTTNMATADSTNSSYPGHSSHDLLSLGEFKVTLLQYAVFGIGGLIVLMATLAIACKIKKCKQGNRAMNGKPAPKTTRVQSIGRQKWDGGNDSETKKSRKRSMDMRNHNTNAIDRM